MANHLGVGATTPLTNTIGPKQTSGKVRTSSIVASPVLVAGTGWVLMLLRVPAALRQLRVTIHWGTGLVPAFGPAARTSPSTSTRRVPSWSSRASPPVILHGNPPPGILRMAKPAVGIPRSRSNSKSASPAKAGTAMADIRAALKRTRNAVMGGSEEHTSELQS